MSYHFTNMTELPGWHFLHYKKNKGYQHNMGFYVVLISHCWSWPKFYNSTGTVETLLKYFSPQYLLSELFKSVLDHKYKFYLLNFKVYEEVA